MTGDNKIVVSGYSVFKFMETKGLPLDFMLSHLDKDEYVVDWLEFILTAEQHNWKLKGTLIKIENAMTDVYGSEYSDTVIETLYVYCEKWL